jgi:hypothetical protein
VTALSSSGLVVCLSRVPGSGPNEVAGDLCTFRFWIQQGRRCLVPSGSGSDKVVRRYTPLDSGSSEVRRLVTLGGPCNVRSLLSCTWSIWQNDSPKT